MSQSFKLGFARALAENGMSVGDFATAIEKKAGIDPDGSGGILNTVANIGFVWPAALSIGGGYLLGNMLGKTYNNLNEPDEVPTIEDLKNEELIKEIKAQSALLARKQARRKALTNAT